MAGPKIDASQEAVVRAALARGESVRAASRAAECSLGAAQRIDRDARGVGVGDIDAKVAAAVAKALSASGVRPPAEVSESVDPADAAKATALLRRKSMNLGEVAVTLKVCGEKAAEWLDEQKAAGMNVAKCGGLYSIEKAPAATAFGDVTLEVESDDDGCFTLGAMGDTHICSKYERLDVLNDLYDQYAREGVRDVFHAGNWIDGEARFNKHDLLVHGMNAQIEYMAKVYPKRDGIHTYAVAGDDHEGWYCQQTGVDIGGYAQTAMRKAGHAWTNLGYMEAFVRLVNRKSGKSSMLHVVHPGGGSSYALSYTVQKLVESYGGGEKPAVLFAGHYHKMELVNVRNVWCVQTGCCQDQTPFMRKKRLDAHVGGHVIRLRQDERTGAIVEMNGMKRYFNVGFYNDRWSMSGPVKLPRRTIGGAV